MMARFVLLHQRQANSSMRLEMHTAKESLLWPPPPTVKALSVEGERDRFGCGILLERIPRHTNLKLL